MPAPSTATCRGEPARNAGPRWEDCSKDTLAPVSPAPAAECVDRTAGAHEPTPPPRSAARGERMDVGKRGRGDGTPRTAPPPPLSALRLGKPRSRPRTAGTPV